MNARQRLPVVTLLLIAANIGAAFVVQWNPQLVTLYGFEPSYPTFKTAFTSLFLHQNVLHLLGNMVFLAAVGPLVESAAGTIRFLVVYLLGGFAGVVVHWVFTDKTGSVPLIGASGCVSACIAYYSLRYHHTKVNIAPNTSVRVLWIIAIWVALQVGGAFVSMGSVQPGIAYWSHVGGFAMGLILSITFRAPQEAHTEKARQAIESMESRSPAAKLAATDLFLKDHPDDKRALMERADALAKLDEPEEEAGCLVKLLPLLSDEEQPEVLIRLNRMNRLDALPSLKRTFLADRYKAKMPDLSRALLMSVVRVMTDNQRPEALLALASLDHETHPETAEIWLRDLFTNYPMHPASELARAKGWSP